MNLIRIVVEPLLLLIFITACRKPAADTPFVPIANIDTIEVEKIDSIIPPATICGVDVLDYLMGRFEPSANNCFQLIPRAYVDKPNLYLRNETLKAFIEMHKAAKEDGINLMIISATRNFEYQKGIWERKWSGKTKLEGGKNATSIKPDSERAKAIMKYSAMPGASRHHWGTDLDINSLNNGWFGSGEGKKLYDWMQTEGKKFGFYQVYTSKEGSNRKGYEEEKWHYTYKPVSKELTNLADQLMSDIHLKGFSGSESAVKVQVKANYIMGINPECYE